MKNLRKFTAIIFRFWEVIPQFSTVRFFAIFGSYAALFGHILGVRGVKRKFAVPAKMRIFRDFAWNDGVKSPFCIVGTSWIGLTHGNVIFDILETPAFQKYSICWVFQAFFYSFFVDVFCNSTKTSAYSSEQNSKKSRHSPLILWPTPSFILFTGARSPKKGLVITTLVTNCDFERMQFPYSN